MAATSLCKRLQLTAILLCTSLAADAGVLPDDRADVLYHSYEGGGVEINGPSVMVLKKIGQNVALNGNYYVDSISSASIDVVTSGASAYTEERKEFTGGADYLHGNSTISVSYTNSTENDYEANTASFGISMDMFENMTTVSMGYIRGWDTVQNNLDDTFSRDVNRQNYKLGLSQVITKDMVMELNYEGITDEGFLNNPYRTVRWYDELNNTSGTQPEMYPNTRTSSAVALRARYYLPYRAAISGEYRYFTDTWGIDAHTLEAGYTHPLAGGWTVDGHYRYYTQGAADFYSDLFPHEDAQNFLARDKELSTFSSHTFGVRLSYDFLENGWHSLERGTVNVAWDHIMFNYDDFRDLRVVSPVPGEEPFYSFAADVFQLYLSVWF
ncbi:MAG: DUF3570 domain-containing protein [Pseudomonadota bacterium]